MSRPDKNIFRRLNAALLQRLLMLFSLPLFATACHVPQQTQNIPTTPDTTQNLVVEVAVNPDTVPVVKADTLIPVYECPVTVTPCYGVVATPIFQESIEINFEAPEL